MRLRYFTTAKLATALLASLTTVCFGGDKIEFSTPATKSESSPRTKEIPKGSPNLLESFRQGGIQGGALFSPPPTVIPDRSASARDKKKDWTANDRLPTAEEIFKIKTDKSDQAGPTKKDKSKSSLPSLGFNDTSTDNELNTLSRNSTANNSNTSDGFRPRPDQSGQSRAEQFNEERTINFGDLLKDGRDMERDRFANRALERRADFEQMFQARTVENIHPTVDPRTQPNSPFTVPDDLLGRTAQNGLSGQFKDVGTGFNAGRSFSLNEDLNPRLGRNVSALEDKREDLRAQPKPGVLPFPERPGQLFKTPGRF